MYSNYPTVSTYRTQRVPLAGILEGRDGISPTKDQRYVNFFVETFKDKTTEEKSAIVRQRPGMTYSSTTGVTGEGRGIYYFNNSLYAAVGNQLLRDNVVVATLGNSTGRVGFTEFNGTYTCLIVLDGVNGYVIKTDNSVTQITSVDFPTPHLPYPVFIDGYVFVAKAGTDDIYNCDLENPLSWTAGSFITAELAPDTLVALSMNNNYLVALGTKTVEQFYDSGNPSGSPLQRNDSAVQQMGCVAADSVVTLDDGVVFVGNTANGGRTVWHVSGFQPTEIGTQPLKQFLDSLGTSTSQIIGTVVRTKGHRFYILNTDTRTWVFDFDEGRWHEWTSGSETTPFYYKRSCDYPDGKARFIHPTNGNIVKVDSSVAHDDTASGVSTTIYGVITSDRVDFGTINRKFCSRLSVIGDSPNGNNTVNVGVQWSDDDYVTWSTLRQLDLGAAQSFITQLGSFKRRAFKIVYNQEYPMRFIGLELDLNIGNR